MDDPKDATWYEADPEPRGWRDNWPRAIPAAILVAVAAGVAFLAWPADARDFSQSRMTLLPGDGACFARVEIENRFGVYNRTETIETPRGPVQITYTTIGGHKPGDDDLIEVAGLPPGVTAHPFSASIVDGEKLIVCLMEYVGA